MQLGRASSETDIRRCLVRLWVVGWWVGEVMVVRECEVRYPLEVLAIIVRYVWAAAQVNQKRRRRLRVILDCDETTIDCADIKPDSPSHKSDTIEI